MYSKRRAYKATWTTSALVPFTSRMAYTYIALSHLFPSIFISYLSLKETSSPHSWSYFSDKNHVKMKILVYREREVSLNRKQHVQVWIGLLISGSCCKYTCTRKQWLPELIIPYPSSLKIQKISISNGSYFLPTVSPFSRSRQPLLLTHSASS